VNYDSRVEFRFIRGFAGAGPARWGWMIHSPHRVRNGERGRERERMTVEEESEKMVRLDGLVGELLGYFSLIECPYAYKCSPSHKSEAHRDLMSWTRQCNRG